jgi:hypothetical protein
LQCLIVAVVWLNIFSIYGILDLVDVTCLKRAAMITEPSANQDRELRWLQHWGFTENPFAQCEAGREEHLQSYFFGRFHDAIKGSSSSPQSCFVFADRGCGKTAQRVMIERTCQPLDRDGDILAVPYINFAETVEQAGGDPAQVRLEHHIRQIVICGVQRLLQMFFQRPRYFLEILPEDRGALCWFLANYGARAWSPLTLLKQLREWQAIAPEVSFQDVQEALESRDIRRLLVPDFLARPHGQMLALLVETEPITILSTTSSAVHLLSAFVSLVSVSQCRALYMLVDSIDELPPTWDSPVAAASLIRPLTHNTEITEMPRIAFKFFLPTEMEPELGTVLRGGRFPAYRLSWDGEGLFHILRARLRHFNTKGIDSLGALAEPEISADIDERIIEYAASSPRRLIVIGRDLVERKTQADDKELLINREDLLAVLEQADRREYGTALPALRLNREQQLVVIGRREIKLPSIQYKVLCLLYEAEGDIKSKDDIFDEVYQVEDGVTDQAIDSLIWRIRQRIERDPRNPQYLITERGEGYRLQNTG